MIYDSVALAAEVNRFIQTKGGLEDRMRNPSFVYREAEKFVTTLNRWNLRWLACSSLVLLALPAVARSAPPDGDNRYVLERKGRTIVLEPYGPNIVRITLSTEKPAASAAPGYG